MEYPPFIWGGIGTFAKNLAVGLCREGVEVTVVTGYPLPSNVKSIDTDEDNNPLLEVIRFPYLNLHPKGMFFQLTNLKKIYEAVSKSGADLVHGQCLSTFPALIRLKKLVPLVVTFHTSPKIERAIVAHSLLRGGSFEDFWTYMIGYPAWSIVFREELRNSSMAVAVSRNLMSELLQEMGETYRPKMRTVHNGVDIETLDREYQKVEDEVEESDDTILFAGRLEFRKGALNLIKLAHQLQKEKVDLRLIVHGTGSLFGRINKAVTDLGLTNIELKGFTSRTELMRSMKKSKFLVIPSFYEACPMILLEGMCLGKIPVMFDLPYSVEFTENGKYGVLAKNTKELVAKLKTMRENVDLKNLSNKMKDFGRKSYNMRNTSREYLDLYKALTER